MRWAVSRWSRSWVYAALGAVLVWMPGCVSEEVPEARVERSEPPLSLVVVTPHNARIRERFEEGFNRWHSEKHGREVNIQWVSRGTPQCLEYIAEAASSDATALRRQLTDLMFGGGITDHRRLVERGLARPVEAPLPGEELIPERLHGVPLRDPGGYWHPTALSTFGIFRNRAGCEQRGITPPTTWKGLAAPELFGWVALPDPGRSGSTRFALAVVLQRYGWDEGWGVILRWAANARTMLPSSTAMLDAVEAGMCLAGPSVNFTAQNRAAAAQPGRLDFVAPADATAITPDVMTILRYAPSPDLALRFAEFCLSDAGQALWCVVPGEGEGAQLVAAASMEPLYRYPVVPAVYEKYAGHMTVKRNPYEIESDFAVDMDKERQQAPIIAPLLSAACGENHVLLQQAWRAVIEAGLPSGALAELTRCPLTEKQAHEASSKLAEDPGQAEQMSAEWASLFKEKYEQILGDLGG